MKFIKLSHRTHDHGFDGAFQKAYMYCSDDQQKVLIIGIFLETATIAKSNGDLRINYL